LIDTLNYLSTEVHKRVFYPIFSSTAAPEAKEAARAQLEPTLDYLSRRLGERAVLVGETFTVADAYLVTMLNWFRYLKVDLRRWPNIAAYHKAHLARPSVAQAMAEEMAEREKRAA
jgi:glutathione S-transferase